MAGSLKWHEQLAFLVQPFIKGCENLTQVRNQIVEFVGQVGGENELKS
jgi:hypothetical protein